MNPNRYKSYQNETSSRDNRKFVVIKKTNIFTSVLFCFKLKLIAEAYRPDYHRRKDFLSLDFVHCYLKFTLPIFYLAALIITAITIYLTVSGSFGEFFFIAIIMGVFWLLAFVTHFFKMRKENRLFLEMFDSIQQAERFIAAENEK